MPDLEPAAPLALGRLMTFDGDGSAVTPVETAGAAFEFSEILVVKDRHVPSLRRVQQPACQRRALSRFCRSLRSTAYVVNHSHDLCEPTLSGCTRLFMSLDERVVQKKTGRGLGRPDANLHGIYRCPIMKGASTSKAERRKAFPLPTLLRNNQARHAHALGQTAGHARTYGWVFCRCRRQERRRRQRSCSRAGSGDAA